MKVYHGSTTWKMQSLIGGDFTKYPPGLYVTDTFERAARYANSQADQQVTTRDLPLSSCAVVIALEPSEDVLWRRRLPNHPTLDTCETTIRHGHIVEVFIGRPGRFSAREHNHIEILRNQLQDIPVHVLDPLPTIHNQ